MGLVTYVSDYYLLGAIELGEENLRRILRDFGTTDKEAEVYIFLAKHGVLKGGEIVQRTKTHKAIIYRILKSLQKKGLIESSLEAPARFTAVPFGKVLDSNIEAKQEETARIKAQKKEILSYWNTIFQAVPEQSLEKFSIIEGSHKIYPKISQLIKETANQFCAVAPVPSLIRAEKYGVLDAAFSHPSRSKIQLRFLTEINKADPIYKSYVETQILLHIPSPSLHCVSTSVTRITPKAKERRLIEIK